MMQGVVEGISTNYGKFSVLVDGIWYGTKEEYATFAKPNKGDTIEFDNGGEGKKYLQRVKIVSAGAGGAPAANAGTSPARAPSYRMGTFPIDPLDGQRSIIRQNSLTNAVNIIDTSMEIEGNNYATTDALVEAVLTLARRFEAYSAGDLDRAKAAEMAKEDD